MPEMKIHVVKICIYYLDLKEVADNKLPHLDLLCLLSVL